MTSIKHDILLAAVLVAILVLLAHAAFGDEYPCPNNQPCKIITINPQEEQSLVQPGGVLDGASFANKMGLEGVVAYWKNKLQSAPAGKVEKPKLEAPAKPDDKQP